MKRFCTSLFLVSFALFPVVRLGAQTAGATPRAREGENLIAAAQRDDRDRPDQDRRDLHSDLRITRALYGSGKHIVDVTSRLNSQIRQGRLSIPVINDTMGGDPYRNRAKTLQVWYTAYGRSAQVTLNENDFLQLPPGANDDDHRDDRGPDNRGYDNGRADNRGYDNGGPDNGGYDQARMERVVLPPGTEISVLTNERIDSRDVVEGQTFSAQIAEDVRDSDRFVGHPAPFRRAAGYPSPRRERRYYSRYPLGAGCWETLSGEHRGCGTRKP